MRIKGVLACGWALMAVSGLLAQQCRVTALSPAQPPLKVEEGEKATESETFLTAGMALSPANEVYIFDGASRIRRLSADGRLFTVAGNGIRGEQVMPGDARAASLPAITQMIFSRDGVLHFSYQSRVFRIVSGQIEVVAGSGRPGFNGEEGGAQEINLGNVVHMTFDFRNELLLLDGFNRLRRLGKDGMVRTIAGSTRVAAAAGLTGDNGPAAEAALSSPRQVVAFSDGTIWLKDLSGRHLRRIGPDGIIRTLTQSFDASTTILQWADGSPGASSANRVYPIAMTGQIETGRAPFAPFTGTPRAIDSTGALFYEGSTRPEQRNPLVRMAGRQQTVLAGAPVAVTVDGQAPPYGVWNPRTNTLHYSALVGGKFGVVEVRAGQAGRFVVGGGADISDADGKKATDLTVYGVTAFTIDGEGNVIVGDLNRRRILVVGGSGTVSVLKDDSGAEIIYAPLGSMSTLQRIAADDAGNIYWFWGGATPTGGIFQAEIAVWSKSNRRVTRFPVQGLYQVVRLSDGTAAAIAGNASAFRRVYRISPVGLGAALEDTALLPYVVWTRHKGKPVFLAASRLFRGAPGEMEYFDLPNLPNGTPFTPDFVLANPDHVLVHLTDGGFYRIEDLDQCKWVRQPVVSAGGVTNAANGGWVNLMSPRQLLTMWGTGLGPEGGQGFNLDGSLRATGQAAPFPALTLGNFSGTAPFATLTGTTLPVLYSDDRQATYQGITGAGVNGGYLLYYSWQGMTVIHPETVRVAEATPALFSAGPAGEGSLVAAENDDGSRHTVDNPAPAGSVVRMFGTGFGAMTNNLGTGEFCGATPVATVLGIEATIGGEPALVEFSGCVPGTIAGNYQVRVQVPPELPPGLHEVRLRAGTAELAEEPKMVLRVGPPR